MEYEDLTYEECFNKIFNEININKKSINKLNDIVINQKKEIEELKNEIEDLKKYNIVYEKENLKEINKKIYSCRIENLEFFDERINEIINILNVETGEIKEEIKNIQENEIKSLNNNFANLNIEIKEEIKNIQENEIKSLNNNFANLNIEIKEEIKNRKKIEIANQETNKRNKIMEEENNKIAKHDNEIIVLKQTIEYIKENEIEELKNEIEDLKKTNEKERKNLEKYQNANEEDIDSHNNEIINLKQIIQNIQENEIEYIYENIANLNIEVKENIKINSNTNNEIIELKEIKNNLHFSYVISSYKYHIDYLKDIVKLEIDLFTKLINNNILPINFITPQGNDNDLGQYWHVTKHFMNKDDNKEKLKKYFNVNDIMNNKYSFDLTNYICFNNTKFIDFSGRFIHNYYEKNTHNKYSIPIIYGRGNFGCNAETKISYNKIYKNNFYKSLYNEKNELIIDNNDFIKMIEMKEDIDEMEEMILDCLERYEFMKTLKTNTIYLNDK